MHLPEFMTWCSLISRKKVLSSLNIRLLYCLLKHMRKSVINLHLHIQLKLLSSEWIKWILQILKKLNVPTNPPFESNYSGIIAQPNPAQQYTTPLESGVVWNFTLLPICNSAGIVLNPEDSHIKVKWFTIFYQSAIPLKLYHSAALSICFLWRSEWWMINCAHS